LPPEKKGDCTTTTPPCSRKKAHSTGTIPGCLARKNGEKEEKEKKEKGKSFTGSICTM
jgi:hypothetical protein